MKRRLIVNADDFGLSVGTNAGIIRAHEQGIVTSASLMPRAVAALQAAEYARRRPQLSVGLHLDFGEWIFLDGEWAPSYEVVDLEDTGAVRDEVQHQIKAFTRLMGKPPTHIDSHQHVHRRDPVCSVVVEAARELRIPVRQVIVQTLFGSDSLPPIQYIGDFYGQTAEGGPFPQGISHERFAELVKALPEGILELGCHPGEDVRLNSPYRLERIEEMKVLCDLRAKEVLKREEVELCSFAECWG